MTCMNSTEMFKLIYFSAEIEICMFLFSSMSLHMSAETYSPSIKGSHNPAFML